MANYKDPTDHFRTTLPHTGEHFIDVYSWPGYLFIVLGTLSLIGCVTAAAYRQSEWIPTAGIAGAFAVAGGTAWLVLEHRRVLRIETSWQSAHSNDHR